MKHFVIGVSLLLVSITSLAQKNHLSFKPTQQFIRTTLPLNLTLKKKHHILPCNSKHFLYTAVNKDLFESKTSVYALATESKNHKTFRKNESLTNSTIDIGLAKQEPLPFFKNRRNVYSTMWAFASLNYLYADLVGLMDKNVHAQYENGVVNGTKITPGFLTSAAAFMQIPLANVFLPQVIKNERTLKWVQIASGALMTLVQSSTLFVGELTPYYALFSTFEIAATTYITIDAFKWKPSRNKNR